MEKVLSGDCEHANSSKRVVHAIRDALSGDGRVRDVRVEVKGLVVTLEGQVGSFYARQVADHFARSIAKNVHNDFRLESNIQVL